MRSPHPPSCRVAERGRLGRSLRIGVTAVVLSVLGGCASRSIPPPPDAGDVLGQTPAQIEEVVGREAWSTAIDWPKARSVAFYPGGTVVAFGADGRAGAFTSLGYTPPPVQAGSFSLAVLLPAESAAERYRDTMGAGFKPIAGAPSELPWDDYQYYLSQQIPIAIERGGASYSPVRVATAPQDAPWLRNWPFACGDAWRALVADACEPLTMRLPTGAGAVPGEPPPDFVLFVGSTTTEGKSGSMATVGVNGVPLPESPDRLVQTQDFVLWDNALGLPVTWGRSECAAGVAHDLNVLDIVGFGAAAGRAPARFPRDAWDQNVQCFVNHAVDTISPGQWRAAIAVLAPQGVVPAGR